MEIGQLNTTRLLLEVYNPTYHKNIYLGCYQLYYNITHALSPFLTWVLQESCSGKKIALCRSAQIKGKNFRMFSPEMRARKELPHKYKSTFLQVKLFLPFQTWRCWYPASHQDHKFCFPAHILCDLQWTMWHWNRLFVLVHSPIMWEMHSEGILSHNTTKTHKQNFSFNII
jgi:hypothetical protein